MLFRPRARQRHALRRFWPFCATAQSYRPRKAQSPPEYWLATCKFLTVLLIGAVIFLHYYVAFTEAAERLLASLPASLGSVKRTSFSAMPLDAYITSLCCHQASGKRKAHAEELARLTYCRLDISGAMMAFAY